MTAITRRRFEEIAEQENHSSGGVVVIMEDGRMGLINHWNDETCMVDIYVRGGCETAHVPWSNLSETWSGILVSVKGAIWAHEGLTSKSINS